MSELAEAALRPRMRGLTHQYAFFVAVALGAALVSTAPGGRATVAAAIYAVAVCGLFGVSALYHRITWSASARRWMRRLDHSMIFVFIAASYTPVALLVLHGELAVSILCVVWGGALAGAVMKLFWIDAPKWLAAALYVVLGWVAVAALPDLWDALGWLSLGAFGLGGALYTAGAIIYARGRPNPWPRVFGYHEIFHVLVIAAAATHYAVIAFAVLPRG
jgi:hemolysin III